MASLPEQKILENPFRTDSAHKAYEQALQDIMKYLIEHNEAHKMKRFALGYPFVLSEDGYWPLRQRISGVEGK